MEDDNKRGPYAVGKCTWTDAEIKCHDLSYLISDSDKLTDHAGRTKDVPTRDRTKVQQFYRNKDKPRGNRTKGRTISELDQDRADLASMSPVNRNLKRARLKLELEIAKKVLRSQNINVKQLFESKVAEASAKVGHLSVGSELRLDDDGIIRSRTFTYHNEYDRELDNIETATVLRNEPSSEKRAAVRNIRNSVSMMELRESISLLKPHMADMSGGQKAEVCDVSLIVYLLHLFSF